MVITSLGSLRKVKSTQAGSGLEAIERLAIEPVDLMVLDLNMPDMHGMEVIDFMRSHQAYRNIPIVVLTTKGEESSRTQALAAGANRYLTKPFDPRQLADVRERNCGQRRTDDSLDCESLWKCRRSHGGRRGNLFSDQ